MNSSVVKIKKRRSSIRRSTSADIHAIHAWLVEEEEQGVHGNFLSNWRIIRAAHDEGDLLVYVDGESGVPVGYQIGGLVLPGILQVRSDFRGKGVGRKLVNHCVKRALKTNECLLWIECTPRTSIGFWTHMGFMLLDKGGGGNYAYRILQKQHALPVDGRPVDAVLRFFPEECKWRDGVQPHTTSSPMAVITSDGIVHLAERTYFFENLYPMAGDLVAEVMIDGSLRYRDKAKYKDAQQIGIYRCTNGFYIDKVHPVPTVRAVDT